MKYVYVDWTEPVLTSEWTSVMAPANISDSEWGKLPVLVWIHGGGYQRGNMQGYNGTEMIAGSGYRFIEVAFRE